jgi:hypothetical protein
MSDIGHRAALRLLGAPAVWLMQFSALYGPKAYACSRGLAEHYPAFAVAVTALAAAAVLAIMLVPQRDANSTRRFLDLASVALGLLGLFAIVWTALPVILLPECAGPG